MSAIAAPRTTESPVATRRATVVRWILPLLLLLAFAGYVGAWVDHKVAGLVITGLDLGEYVKFLTPVRQDAVSLWREGFYLPLVAVSLTASLIAFRVELRYPWVVRAGLLALAVVASLNLLPPAWTPTRMMTAEFRQQAVALGVCLMAMACSPLLALLPHRLVAVGVVALSSAAILIPMRQFFAVLPAISELYRQPLLPGWGVYLCTASLLALAGVMVWWGWMKPR